MNFDLQLSAMQPEGYIELMQECWNSDPEKRPAVNELKSKFITCWSIESKNPTKIIKSPDIGPMKTKYPGTVYKSRPLSAMIKSIEFTNHLKSKYFFTFHSILLYNFKL